MRWAREETRGIEYENELSKKKEAIVVAQLKCYHDM